MCLRNFQRKVSCTISHFGLGSFVESIEHVFKEALKIQTDNQMLTQVSQEGIRVG